MASASGSRGWSDSRRGISVRGAGGARLLLYLGLCHMGLGAMVLAFSFTSMAFTSSARVRQSCPFWAGFFVSKPLSPYRIHRGVILMSSVAVCPGGGLRDRWDHLLEKTFNTGGKDCTFKHKEADSEAPSHMYDGSN